MTATEFDQYLLRLNLTGSEAAQLLGVTPRTMQRWLDSEGGEQIPGPAVQAVRAWIKLHDLGIPWRPDSRSIDHNDEQQIGAQRRHAVDVAALITRVEARGGPRIPWNVDHSRCLATLGKIEVSFYKLTNGGFSLANYTRRDMTPDLARDNELLEDAAYYIYLSRRKDPDFGPVTLHWNNIPPRNGARPAVADTRTFSSNEAALKQACKLMGSRGFHEPFIATKAGELIFDKLDLRQECETRAKAPNALEAVAQSIRKNKALFSTRGPTMLTPIERANHERLIESLADRLDALADKARQGRADYRQFDDVLRELHAANFFPDRDLVSTAARALVYAT